MIDSFPRQQARTHRFTLGAPRTFVVGADGSRVLFLRSASGTDPVTGLWVLDVATGAERLLVDPATLDAGDGPTAEERAQRERRRERAGGVTSYSADAALRRVVFVLDGRLWIADIGSGKVAALGVSGPVFDPRLDPTGTRVAWCRGAELWFATLDAAGASGEVDEHRLAGEDAAEVTWGQAEFVAAEEMGRLRGHWWTADGVALLAARVDVTPVATWWVADPAQPSRPPVAHRYPAAGTADADVSLWRIELDGTRRPIVWDVKAYPYLVAVDVSSSGPPLLAVERRDHTAGQVLAVDNPPAEPGAPVDTSLVAAVADEAWLDWVPGLPTRLDDGRPVWSAEHDATTGLVVDGEVVTPAGLQVRAVVGAGVGLVFTAWRDPTQVELWRWSAAGVQPLAGSGVVVAAAGGGSTTVVSQRVVDRAGVRCEVLGPDGAVVTEIASHTSQPVLAADVRFLEVGPDRLRVGVVLPRQHRPGTPLPVLMHPYGGPGAQMVVADQHAWLEAQWRADQGFAVVVCDGRGTPGRGPRWDRRIYRDFATGVLEDQVTGLHGAAAELADLDLTRVGITGWSFGGYLAALAVLRRPDVFHAAVAGAPVTDWRLYDTYYTEKYLGHPDVEPGVYDRSSLLDDAPALRRPLMIIHGLVDDNVVVAHTLRLSQGLLQAGRPHAVLPLSGVTHMASQEEVAENLLRLQMAFLADALGVPAPA
jgi:dipeptidyl-peptidase-4